MLKWIPKDIEQYIKAQEYIDTAVIPLISVAFGESMIQSAAKSEFITLLTTLLERQFTGRILLLPPFTYIKEESLEKNLNQLESWISAVNQNRTKHIFLLTCDSEWKMHEDKLKDSLIWLPALTLENLEDSQKVSLIDSQVKQLLALFTQKWQENE